MSGEHSKPIRLASVAWHAALDRKWQRAADAIKRISDECGGEGLATALMAWSDAYTEHATEGRDHRVMPRINFINGQTGQLDDQESDRIPARIRWAGQLIAARAGMDEPRFSALLEELPEDGLEIGRYVLAVLEMTSESVNGLPRGFARMGRGGTPNA